MSHLYRQHESSHLSEHRGGSEVDEQTEASDRRASIQLSRALIQLSSAPIQRTARDEDEGAELAGEEAVEIASEGVSGASTALPHLDSIQGAFGEHDVSGIEAHVGGDAANAADGLGADAYAMGNQVAFKEQPDLHTAAHEAAHVVQQRGGVQLKGGMGRDGDAFELHADAVADAVVAGRSAEPLLSQVAPPSAAVAPAEAVQRRGPKKPKKKAKVTFDQANDLAQAVDKIVSERNVDGAVTPDSVGSVPDAYKAALWDLYFARVGKIGRCTADGMDLAGGTRLTADQRNAYVTSATAQIGPALKVIVDRAEDKAAAKAFVAGTYDKPIRILKRGITVGTFDEASKLCTIVLNMLNNAGTYYFNVRPDRIEGAPPARMDLLWRFWSGMSGVVQGTEGHGGRGSDLGTEERLERLQSADAELRPFLQIITEESSAKDWVQAKYEPALGFAQQVIGYDGASKTVGGIYNAQKAQANGEDPGELTPQTEVLAAVANGQQTLAKVRALVTAYTRMQGGKMEAALKDSLAKLASEDPKLTVIKDMPVAQALTHIGGLLSGVQAIWTLSSDDERLKEARKRGNIASNLTELLGATTGVLAGTASAMSLIGGGIAVVAGNSALAGELIAIGSRSVRVLGQVAAVFQLTYGLAVMLDPDSTGADRKAAMLHIGMGAGGTLSFLNTTGLLANSWGGPLTIATLVTALELKFVLGKVAGFEKGWFQWTIGQAYRNLEKPATELQDSASYLAIALMLTQGVRPTDEASALEFDGHIKVAENAAKSVKRACWEMLDTATRKGTGASKLETWRIPGNYPEISSKYDGLWDQYKAAESPGEIATLAASVLQATYTVFAGFQDHACDFLQNAHGDSWLYAGMHDDMCGPKD